MNSPDKEVLRRPESNISSHLAPKHPNSSHRYHKKQAAAHTEKERWYPWQEFRIGTSSEEHVAISGETILKHAVRSPPAPERQLTDPSQPWVSSSSHSVAVQYMKRCTIGGLVPLRPRPSSIGGSGESAETAGIGSRAVQLPQPCLVCSGADYYATPLHIPAEHRRSTSALQPIRRERRGREQWGTNLNAENGRPPSQPPVLGHPATMPVLGLQNQRNAWVIRNQDPASPQFTAKHHAKGLSTSLLRRLSLGKKERNQLQQSNPKREVLFLRQKDRRSDIGRPMEGGQYKISQIGGKAHAGNTPKSMIGSAEFR